MSILERDALLENKNANLAAPRSGSPMSSRTRPASAVGGGRGVLAPPGGGRASTGHVSTPKRLDQEMGFLSVGTYFTVSIYILESSVVLALFFVLGLLLLPAGMICSVIGEAGSY